MTNKVYYPVFMDLTDLPCLVVGGGSVAERKIAGLQRAGAKVTVVSPAASTAIQNMAQEGAVRWVQEEYCEGHLRHARLVFGATGDAHVNEQIFNDSRQAGIPANIVDDPDHCSFIVPATLRKGEVQIAVGTGGAAPAVSARIRDEIEAVIGREYEVLVSELKKQRPRIKALPRPVKEHFWQRVASLDIMNHRNRLDELRSLIGSWVTEAESAREPSGEHAAK